MGNRALRKDFYREIKNTLNRFLSISLIVGLGVAFFAGIRSTEPNMQIIADRLYDKTNLMDIRILSTMGLTEDDLNTVKNVYGVEEARGGYSADVLSIENNNQNVIKIYSDPGSINQVSIKEGKLPENENECFVDESYLEITGYKIGDKIKLKSGNDTELSEIIGYDEYTITGYGSISYYLSRSKGNSSIGNGSVSGFIILPKEAFRMEVYTEIYLTVSGAKELISYSDEYQKVIDEVVLRIEDEIQDIRINARYNEIISEANSELADAKTKLSDSETAAESELADAKAKLDEAEQEITDGKKEIEENEIKLLDGQKELEDSKKLLSDAKEEILKGKSELDASKSEYEAGEREYETGLLKYENGLLQLEAGKDSIAEAEAGLSLIDDPEQAAAISQMIIQQKNELHEAEIELTASKQILDQTRTALDLARDQIKAGEQELLEHEREISSNERKIADAEEELKNGETKLQNAKADIEIGEKELEDAKQEYEDAKAEAYEKIEDARIEIKESEEEIAKIKKPEWYVLDRNYLQSNAEFASDAERIGAIGKVFPVIFFLVAALVSLTTMTRMVEEERTQIGTMKALGYSKISIASKYIVYALLATIGGSILGGIAGGMIIPSIIINAYKIMYINLGEVIIELNMKYFFMAGTIAVLCVVAATLLACYKELASQPSELMRPPSPKQGKRVFMERITFIWKRLNFTGKSTVRNLIRYKKRFFMTIFGIGGCMALLLVGYGIKDSIFSISDLQFNKIRTYDGSITLDNKASKDEISEVIKYISDDDRIVNSAFIFESSINAGSGKVEKEAQITVPKELETVNDYFVFRNRITGETYSMSNDGVIITEKLAKLLDVSAGDTIYIKDSKSAKLEVKIDAVTENYVRHYIFMSPVLYQTLFNEEADYNEIIYTTANLSNDLEEELTKDILLLNGVTNNTILRQTAKSFDESMGNLDIITLVLIVSAGSLAFIVLYNLNNINISERKRELATLKILGFYDLEVSEYIFRENIILTVIGTVLGLGLGILLHRFVIITAEIDLVMFGRDIGLMSYIKSILMTCLFSLIVNFSMHFKLRKIDMASSLKSVE